jgi:hypothetical protein
MPFVVAGFFLLKHDSPFGASVAVCWTGQNLLDLAPYVHDATRQQMILLGGMTGRDRPGYHDWNNILRELGWLEQADRIAALTNLFGASVLFIGLLWGAYLLFGQWRHLKG